ncbi:hypothetical protein GDO81_013558 [Engystomops pustulosus]|uniref:Lipid-binding serum glycoprotein C-terminal domain-containing protein n=3 Tax=Engystomops pustulosus TaxID=76066 RepID=A0AAV7B4M0_ENGPU|nr:hypothetical protein GDO81_013558 [Engystomops pustulosus]
MQANSLTAVNMVLSEETFGATIYVKNFQLTLVHSNVGPVKMDNLQKTLSFGLKIMTPVLNERLKKMFLLPFHLQDPIVHVEKGYLLIMTDLLVTTLSHYKMKPENQLYSERFTML